MGSWKFFIKIYPDFYYKYWMCGLPKLYFVLHFYLYQLLFLLSIKYAADYTNATNGANEHD